ncbi:MAG: methylated-DNA--[protein]-cysteine S-methyltransferase [Verrucomicrobia bacterium]|nr:methylated-DNA--[protein]-cysteine S-methyltransferase [Verrucomicrobiota bacterium]
MEVKKTLKPNYVYKVIDSPVGKLKLVASQKGLAAVLWENDDPRRVRLSPVEEDTAHPLLAEAEQQLKEYFSGQRKSFSLRLDPVGTPFQNRVWQALLGIPFGETRRYGELAEQLGSASARRAVGAANGRNPIAIVVPCHRVIGASGELTGFAGGLEVKKRLLMLEGRTGDESKRKKPAASRPAKRA